MDTDPLSDVELAFADSYLVPLEKQIIACEKGQGPVPTGFTWAHYILLKNLWRNTNELSRMALFDRYKALAERLRALKGTEMREWLQRRRERAESQKSLQRRQEREELRKSLKKLKEKLEADIEGMTGGDAVTQTK